MHEQEIKIQSGDAVLVGTLCTPDAMKRFPAVLMVHGSGPLDRNENMKGQQLNIFNSIAHELADYGVASLRYDKRGCGDSSGDFMSAGHADLVEDAVNCLDVMARSEGISVDDLYILGHSEGCIIAPQVSLQRPSIAGLVLLCPFIERLEPILVRQAAQLKKEINSKKGISGFLYRSLFNLFDRPVATQLRKVRETDSPVVRIGLFRQPAKWFREMLELNTEAIFASTRTSMILIAGEKDLQSNPQDIFRIAETAQGQSQTLLIEGMTHLLRGDENPATLMGAGRLSSEPVEAVLLQELVKWILAISAANKQSHATS